MLDRQLSTYIQDNLNQGFSIKQIENALINYGYSKDLVRAHTASYKLDFGPVLRSIPLILLLAAALILKPTLTGFVVKEVTYWDNVSISKSSNADYLWLVKNPADIYSIKVSGSLSQGSEGKVYINNGESSYLLFDSSSLFPTLKQISQQPNADDIHLSYTSETYDPDNDGVETTEGIVAINVAGYGNDLSCTLWEVKSLESNTTTLLCNGLDDCCSFHNLAPSQNSWNETFYLNYGSYGATYNNLVSAQVWNINLQAPSINHSRKANISAQFQPEEISFENICIETCSISGFDRSTYNLYIETNGTVTIDSITYTTLQQVPNHAPSFNLIPSQRLDPGQLVTINLSQYTLDEDNDTLIYSASETDNLTILITQDIATIIPDAGFTGKQYLFFTANDSTALATSNTIEVNIVKSSSFNRSEELRQGIAVVGKPVKWTKIVKLNNTAANISVNISKEALNFSIRKTGRGPDQEISEDKILVVSDGEEKTKQQYEAEKRVEVIDKDIKILNQEKIREALDKDKLVEINNELISRQNEKNKLTGFVISERTGQGFFTRLFNFLFKTGITGYAVAEQANASSTSNTTEIIINDEVQEVEVEYYTKGPYAVEEETSDGKYITIISDEVHYQEILAYATLSAEYKSGNILLYWFVNQTKQPVGFEAFDTNNNNLIDYIQWFVPYLSNQTYELILITKAYELNENRTAIRDIYGYVKNQDKNYTTILTGNYVRVTFEKNLTSDKDITLYARSNVSAAIEVYAADSSTVITIFENISQEGKYKVYLTNLQNTSDTFDLKIINYPVEFDYIIDPPGVCPAGMDGSNTSAAPCEIATCTQVQNMSLDLHAFYMLNRSINCSNTTIWNSGAGFAPIGAFTGLLNGSNHTISNLNINRTGSNSVGLTSENYGTISYLGLVRVNISGASWVGAIAANNYGTINYVYTSGLVKGQNYVGGLIGLQSQPGLYGSTKNSYSSVKVLATGNYVGGLIGDVNDGGTIENTYSYGNVSTTGNYVGGLVGENQAVNANAVINNSFATGNVSGGSDVGGLVGSAVDTDFLGNYAVIENSYYNNHDQNPGSCIGSGGIGLYKNCTSISDNELYFKGDVYPIKGPFSKWGYFSIWEENSSNYPVLTWQDIGGSIDETPPTFTEIPSNATLQYLIDALLVDINATDAGTVHWKINNTIRFNISQSGVLKNMTILPLATYFINVSVNDTFDNLASLIFQATFIGYVPTDSCGKLNQSGKTYTLIGNVSTTANCFNVTTDNITIDGANYYIISDGVGGDRGIATWGNRKNITIRNSNLRGFATSIFLNNTNNTLIANNSIDQGPLGTNGIYLENSNSIRIENNTITMQMFNPLQGIYVYSRVGRSNNINITNNNLNVYTYLVLADAYGIRIRSLGGSTAHSYFIRNNTITVNATAYARGIEINGNLGDSDNHTISNNSIIVKSSAAGASVWGIEYSTSDGSIIRQNNITVRSKKSDSVGIFFQGGSDNNLMDSNTIQSDNYSIQWLASGGNNNILLNNNLSAGIFSIFDSSGRINLLIYNNSFGEIKWTNLTFLKNLNISGNFTFPGIIKIQNNSAYLNTSAFSINLSSQANITLKSLRIGGYSRPAIFKDGYPCSSCHNFTLLNASTVIFNVSSFSNYSIINPPWNGSGILEDPYNISTCIKLQNISIHSIYMSRYFRLTQNIDCLATNSWNAGSGFNPIGSSSNQFQGTLDGNNFSISHVYINRDSSSYIGLFGVTFSTAVIKNLGLINVTVDGRNYVGGLIGSGSGLIEQVFVQGDVDGILGDGPIGSFSVGGFVGEYSGIINNSYAKINVTGELNMGGMVGSLSGTIKNSYSLSNIQSNGGMAGGISGTGGTIQNSFAAGDVADSTGVGGIAGSSTQNTVNVYWDSHSAIPASCGVSNCTTIHNNLDYFKRDLSPDAQSREPFASWDFNTIWEENSTGYPVLRWRNIGNNIESSNIFACGKLTKANTRYTLKEDLNTSTNCFNITADNIIINGNGSTIKGFTDSIKFGIYILNKTNITIKNLTLDNFNYAIYADTLINSTLVNLTLSSSTVGLYLNGSSINNSVSNINFSGNSLDYSIHPGSLAVLNLSNNTLEVIHSTVGKIRWINRLTFNSSNFDDIINFSANSIKVSSTNLPALNTTANITFYSTDSLGYDLSRYPLRNQDICPASICTELQDADTFIFRVTRFTEYSVSGTASSCGDGVCQVGTESSLNCPIDCGCPVGYTLVGGVCSIVSTSPPPPTTPAASGAVSSCFAITSTELPQGVENATINPTLIPSDYELVTDPIKLDCLGEDIEVKINLPAQYTDIKALRCTGQQCFNVSFQEVSSLQCGEKIFELGRETVNETPEVAPLPIEETTVNLTEASSQLRSGDTQVQFYGGVFEGLKAHIESASSTPTAVNTRFKIVGSPIVLELSRTADINTQISLPYSETERIDQNTLAIYVLQDSDWEYLGGIIKTEEHIVTANVTNISRYLSAENKATFALMGLICENCFNSTLVKVYSPDEPSREALILVHGFASSPETYTSLVEDIKIANQPFVVYTFGYQTSKGVKQTAKELTDLLEAISSEFDNAYIISHSLGGLVVQQALYNAYTKNQNFTKFTFLNKVRKVVLIAVPNEGSSIIPLYKNVFSDLINEKSDYALLAASGQALEDLGKGVITPKIEGIDYYVIAGTSSYELNLILLRLRPDLLPEKATSDGIVSLQSAQRVGDGYVNDKCSNYWEINATHTEILNNIVTRRVVSRIIGEGVTDEPLFGNSLYYALNIQSCSSEDVYILVGKKTSEDTLFGPTYCSCGNRVCDDTENELSCPTDCAEQFVEKSKPNYVLFFALLIVLSLLLTAVYKTTKHIQRSVHLSEFRNLLSHEDIALHQDHVKEVIEYYERLRILYEQMLRSHLNPILLNQLYSQTETEYEAILQKYDHRILRLTKFILLADYAESCLRKHHIKQAALSYSQMRLLFTQLNSLNISLRLELYERAINIHDRLK